MPGAISHYRIVEQIGGGGMGVVFRAHDERLDRDVALKVLPPGTLIDESARRRFRKEALALSKLNHPNIATIYDFDAEDGTDFLVMEYIPGLSLASMLASHPLDNRRMLDLAMQFAEGLEAAHASGVIHLDLKPANLRVTVDGKLKILDFGLARIRHDPATRTASTATLTETDIAGTLPYMAPEQLLCLKLDACTDIWAMGCVLYEMSTGRRPFAGSGPALTEAILHQAPTPPSKLNPNLPDGMEAVILKCLDKQPKLRYQSAREVAVDLNRLSAPVVAPAPSLRQRATRRVALRAVLVILAVLAAAFLWRGERILESTHPAPSIAVLPFVDMSAEKNQEYFSDGLAEELLNDLAKIQGLRVAARTSSFRFKGKDTSLGAIGRELKVATVLEGSVRKEGRRVRITAQLIKTSDGFDLWSETYDRELNDIFAVQEEIARAVAASLKVTLLGAKRPASPAPNSEAYNAYLEGQYFRQKRTREDLEKSVTYYEQAIRASPGYALAWSGLAAARLFQANIGYVPFQDGCRRAREAADRAVLLDSRLANGHVATGTIKLYCDLNWSGADSSYERAASLEPGNLAVLEGAGGYEAAMGHFDRALALRHQVIERDPLNPIAYIQLGLDATNAGRHDEAVSAFKKALELNPDNPAIHSSLARVYVVQSRPQEALAEAQQETSDDWRLEGLALAHWAMGHKKESDAALAQLIAKFDWKMAFQIAELYAFRGETDQAFHWLDRAYDQRDAGLTAVKGDPLLKSLEHDPRYAAFLKKMQLPV